VQFEQADKLMTIGWRRARIAAVAAAILVLAGCGGGDDPADGTRDSAPRATTTTTTNTVPQESGAPEQNGTSTSAPPVVDEPGAAAPRPLLAGVPLLAVLTPTADVGIRPMLRWEPVDGAATYRAVVLGAEGQMTWVWAGPESEVPYGGAPFAEDRGDGPIVQPGSTWSVVALDARREVLAISERRGLEP
jgi:hypothetical protein